MARIRTIKPEFFTSEDIVSLSPLARLLYQATWCEADKEGRLQWKPGTFKLRYFPADGSGSWDCPNRRSLGALLDAETVAAVNEQAGLHGANCAPVWGGEKALPLGPATAGCTESQRHSGVVSTRAGEGG